MKPYARHPDRSFRIFTAMWGLVATLMLVLSEVAIRLKWPDSVYEFLWKFGAGGLVYAAICALALYFSHPPTGWDR